MTESINHPPSNSTPPLISRRAVAGAGVWAVPAVVLLSAVPAYAASGTVVTVNSGSFNTQYRSGVQATVRDGGVATAGALVTFTSSNQAVTVNPTSATTSSAGAASTVATYSRTTPPVDVTISAAAKGVTGNAIRTVPFRVGTITYSECSVGYPGVGLYGVAQWNGSSAFLNSYNENNQYIGNPNYPNNDGLPIGGAAPVAMGLDSSAGYVYISCANNTIVRVECSNPVGISYAGYLDVGGYGQVAVLPAMSRVFVAGVNTGVLTVIDSSTFAEVTRRNLGAPVWGLAARANLLYVGVGTNVITLDATTYSEIARVAVTAGGTSRGGVAISPDGATVAAVNDGMARIEFIDTATQTKTASVVATGENRSLVFHPNGSRLYVTSTVSGLRVIDVASKTVLSTTSLRGSKYISIHPDGARAYVSQNDQPNSATVTTVVFNTN